ncbi:sulfotransferase [Comamonas sp. 26]|uniref:sulfotransferase family protein n=1 Tax=Comamonas sp. 26 TaxID=2035201 RepID=UPI000C18F787|nr:sulfotransferase [Comamonas sp. 26]PIG09690.1 sulfotransferase family protein [Comamonas sp. 26]
MNVHTPLQTPQTLQVEELLQAACGRTPGLTDFGDDNYRQALAVLTQSLNTQAKLSSAGLVMMRERLVGQLVNRLIMEDYFKRFPEIDQIEIDDPLVIVGLPRTGTTMLQRTLAVDPRFYSAAWWETRYPAPLVGEGPQDAATRIELAKAEVAQTIEAIPQILSIHPMNATLCDEEFMLMEHSFLCAMDAYADVPSYTAWLDQQDQRPVYKQLKKMLQFLQWQKSQRGEPQGQRWLLKAPQHLHTLEILLSVFPKAQVILTHREPAQTIPSMASMAHTLWQIYSDTPDPLSTGRQWNTRMARGIHHTMQVRDQQDTARFLDIHFSDTVENPMAVLEAVYQFAGLPFTEKARTDAQQWLSSNGREKRAGHDYSLETFGLSEQQLQTDYAQYRARHLQTAH